MTSNVCPPAIAPSCPTPGEKLEISEALKLAAQVSTGRKSYYRDALRALTRHFDSPYAALQIDLPSGSIEETAKHSSPADEQWHRICEEMMLDVRCRVHSVARLFEAGGLQQRFTVLAVPVVDEAILGGSLAVVTQCESKELAAAKLRELQALESQLSLMASAAERTCGQTIDTRNLDLSPAQEGLIEGFTRVSQYDSIRELAFSLTNGMKSQLACEQVSFAMVRQNHVELMSISGCDEIKRRSPGVRLIVDALEECLDCQRRIVMQPASSDTDSAGTAHFLHKRWLQLAGGTAVASIPLHLKDQCVAIIGIRHRNAEQITESSIHRIEELVEPLLPAIQLLDRASQPWTRSLCAALQNTCKKTLKRGRGTAVAAAIIFSLWLAFGTLPYRVAAPCKVVSGKERHIAAPFPGVILDAWAEVGEAVKKGQALVQFDTRDLRNEAAKIEADIRVAELELGTELANKNSAKAAQRVRQIESFEAKLRIVRARIERASIKAPFDSVVLTGNPQSRIGEVVALGEPLLALGSQQSMQLEIATSEAKAPYVKPGQKGLFVTHTRPDVRHTFEINSVHRSSSVVEGNPVYIAEARIHSSNENHEVFCAGMTGFASVETESQRVYWILTHKLLDFLCLQAWKL